MEHKKGTIAVGQGDQGETKHSVQTRLEKCSQNVLKWVPNLLNAKLRRRILFSPPTARRGKAFVRLARSHIHLGISGIGHQRHLALG